MGITAALILTTIMSVLGTVGGGIAANAINAKSIKDTNELNANLQKEINAENIANSKEFAQNQTQWKMADYEAAGLNPVLAAGSFGGSVAPSTMVAPQMQAPRYDFSGISTALNAMNNMMLTMALMNNRSEIAAAHDATSQANTQARNATSQANNKARNDVLERLYQRKAGSFAKDSGYVHSAQQVQQARKVAEDNGDWETIMKALKRMPSKYNWKR